MHHSTSYLIKDLITMRIEKSKSYRQASGIAPTCQIVWGVCGWSGLHPYTHNGFLSFEKIFSTSFYKSFGCYIYFVLPLVGGWVCSMSIYKSFTSSQVQESSISSTEILHNIAYELKNMSIVYNIYIICISLSYS